MTKTENRTEVTEFILVGFTNDPEMQILLFITFFLIYLISLVGNLGMILLIMLDSRLHTPMYFFLSNLSLADFGYSSAVTPKVMAGLLTGDNVISYNHCAAQFFFFGAFAVTESNLLAVMAYDRYAAVCKPLHYTTTMTANVCACLGIGSYVLGFLDVSIHTGNTFRLSFCRSNVIDHFFCDAPPLLAISCSDRYITELHSMDTDKMASVFYAIVIPMLNPLVYSLRNKEVKSAFLKVFGKAKSFKGIII
ncbi:olfactory receptor 5B12-like [Echinops telfairi]|uniref:Olfactory receptor n=1 Tax=Echinops telfairi TaxID=9371 RepID=A0ABM0J563_ECHTE|nr:olfactory receptor 5B12-like [Echinops telfairi]